MLTIILLTSLLVSADAFFVGLSLSTNHKRWYIGVLFIISILTSFAFLAWFVHGLANNLFGNFLQYIIIVFFTILGIKNILSFSPAPTARKNILGLLSLGLCMSIDVVLTVVSLSAETAKIVVPFAVVAAHIFAIFLGGFLGKLFAKPTKHRNTLSGVCLIVVALIKLLSL
jgi:putative Mn2+ efflux pump MntP